MRPTEMTARALEVEAVNTVSRTRRLELLRLAREIRRDIWFDRSEGETRR
jgi:hypothetical protein